MSDICVTTQKKLSFACETTAEPAPIATTTIAFSNSESKPNEPIIGMMIEAVVIRDNVEEPSAVLMDAANKKGNQMLKLVSANAAPNVDAMPEFCNTFPKSPPAPVIKMIEAASLSADPTQPCADSMFLLSFLGRIKDSTHPMNNADRKS